MKVLVGMSGGVDSSVTALLLQKQGHEVVGATMRLGNCNPQDAADAMSVATQLGFAHHVLDFFDEFRKRIIKPYIEAHAIGLTPNPCVECNRFMKFDRFFEAAQQLGCDAVATGHYARIDRKGERVRILRGVDPKKDQSYLMHVLRRDMLPHIFFPLGDFTKSQVREIAKQNKLSTSARPDSQDVCFIAKSQTREEFLRPHMPLHEGTLVDVHDGRVLGSTPAVELVTSGQRKGMGGGTPERRFAVSVDVQNRIVHVGNREDLYTDHVLIRDTTFIEATPSSGTTFMVQTSAHGTPFVGEFLGDSVRFAEPQRRVAPGQSVVFYNDDEVVGGGIADTRAE